MQHPCHSYVFFQPKETLTALPMTELSAAKTAFIAFLETQSAVISDAYATLGLRAGSTFMLHLNAATPKDIQLFVRDLLHTTLGQHLHIHYSLIGLKRASQYNPHKAPAESVVEAPHTYLVVYPFTKTIDWYLLPFDERRSIMKDHVDVGRKFSDDISQLLLYSFGIDDHEFIVSYQMDSLESFQTLVMELRSTEARRYTQNDVPIFLCIHKPLAETLTML